MNPEDIKALIDQLLTVGGTIAVKGFEIAMKQVYVMAAKNMILGAAVLFLLLYIGNATKHIAKEYWNQGHKSTDWENTMMILRVVAIAVGWLVILSCTSYTVSYLINPEWYAIELLLNTIGSVEQ